MFTIEQIKNAHSKVKSGADFPAYIQEIKKLGVHYYDVLVANGNADYYSKRGDKVATGERYSQLTIAEQANVEQFKADIKAHQEGKTDYPTFCMDCAKSGVEKWVIRMEEMTCTYYDLAGNELLIETIPQ